MKTYFLLLSTFVLGYLAQKKKNKIESGTEIYKKEKFVYRFFLFCIFFIFTEYAGLRKWYNDTTEYITEFNVLASGTWARIFSINIFKDSYPFFVMYMNLIKHFTKNSQIFLLVNAILINTAFLTFYFKHAKYLHLTILVFIIIQPFVFTLAALKQCFAMALEITAVRYLLEKRYKTFIFLILLATRFHPLSIMFLSAMLFTDEVWSKKMVIITLSVFVIGFGITEFMNVFLGVVNYMGTNYDAAILTDHTVNPLRALVDSVPLIMSYKLRNRINSSGDGLVILSINLTTLQGLMSIASLFANPVLVYRAGLYFSILEPIAIPWLLKEAIPNGWKWKKVFIIGYLSFYTLLFMYEFSMFDLGRHHGVIAFNSWRSLLK